MQTHPSDRHPWSFHGGWHVPRAEGASAYGPQPQHLIGETEAIDLAKSRKRLEEDRRRQAAWERFLVLIEQHKSLVWKRVGEVFEDQKTREQVLRHADASVNLARDITRDLCCVWKHDAERTIKDATDTEKEAFLQLVGESRFASHARAWNRFAFYEGPTTVIPVVRADRMTWDTLLPHAYDVRQNPEDQWGAPLAAIWSAWKPATMVDLPPDRRPEADAVILDGKSWHYISLSKGDAAGGEKLATVHSEPHGLDVFPGATLRFDEFGWGDWWGIDPNVRLQDVTIQLGFIVAVLGYVRKSQNRKLLTAIGDIEGIPKGQTANAEVPLEAYTKSPEQISIQALDLNVDPESFIKHATWLMQLVARSYGGQVVASVGSASLLEADVQFSYDVLTELRNEQIPQARDFERDLWTKAVGIAKTNGHPLADKLPDPEKVREGFNVEFPRLARSFASIDEEIKFWDFALKNGRAAYGDLMRAEMPLATDEERDAAIEANVERQVPIVELFTKRDISQDPMARPDAGLKTPAQQFGAQGPAVRDDEEPPPEEKPKQEESE